MYNKSSRGSTQCEAARGLIIHGMSSRWNAIQSAAWTYHRPEIQMLPTRNHPQTPVVSEPEREQQLVNSQAR